MTLRSNETPTQTFLRLWKRAPVWRTVGLGATLLTSLCLLFPPRFASPVTQDAPAAQATYTAQPAAEAPPKVVAAPPPPTSAATPPMPPPVAAQTAQLSLSSPNASRSADGMNDALAGRRYSRVLRVDGFDVPLPTGEWLLLANLRFKLPTATGEQLFLGRVQSHRLMGAMQVTAARSNDMPGAGFPKVQSCDDHTENANHVVNEGVEDHGHEACWVIDHMFMSPLEAWADRSKKLPQLLRVAAGDLASKGVSYPQDMISLRLTRAETWGLLEVRYIFNPEEEHIQSSTGAAYADSDWQPGTVNRYPEKSAYLEKLRRWGDGFWPQFKAAFEGGRPSATAGASARGTTSVQ